VFPADGKPPYFRFAGPRYGLHVSVQVPGDADRRPRVTSLAATLEFMVTLIERADLVGGGWRRLFISLLCRICVLELEHGTWNNICLYCCAFHRPQAGAICPAINLFLLRLRSFTIPAKIRASPEVQPQNWCIIPSFTFSTTIPPTSHSPENIDRGSSPHTQSRQETPSPNSESPGTRCKRAQT
jgi:hypothetical protein